MNGVSMGVNDICFQLRKNDEYLHICHTCWWKIETFHVYYLEIQEAQTFFESMALECTEYTTSNDLSSTNIKEEETDDTNDKKYGFECDNPSDTLGEWVFLLL